MLFCRSEIYVYHICAYVNLLDLCFRDHLVSLDVFCCVVCPSLTVSKVNFASYSCDHLCYLWIRGGRTYVLLFMDFSSGP